MAPELTLSVYPDCPAQCCSIGFSETQQKWYGWSHRAVNGYGIGDIIQEGDGCTVVGVTQDYLRDHPEANIAVPVGFEVKTLEDAKRCAMAFAECVG